MLDQNSPIVMLTRNYYQKQDIRLREGSRIINRVYLEQLAEKEDVLEKLKNKEFAAKYRQKKLAEMCSEYANTSELINGLRTDNKREAWLKENGKLLKNLAIYTLVESYVKAKVMEDRIAKVIQRYVEPEELWQRYLVHVKGAGPIIAALIISYFDIDEARHVSSFWKFCGLDVVINENGEGEGRGKRESHLIEREYIDKNGEKKKKKSITYNETIKSKMVFVLGRSLMMVGGPYKDIYEAYHHRMVCKNEALNKGWTKSHIFNKARRYMVKMFLKDLWIAWRKLAGYKDEGDYFEDKIAGRRHGKNYSPYKLDIGQVPFTLPNRGNESK